MKRIIYLSLLLVIPFLLKADGYDRQLLNGKWFNPDNGDRIRLKVKRSSIRVKKEVLVETEGTSSLRKIAITKDTLVVKGVDLIKEIMEPPTIVIQITVMTTVATTRIETMAMIDNPNIITHGAMMNEMHAMIFLVNTTCEKSMKL